MWNPYHSHCFSNTSPWMKPVTYLFIHKGSSIGQCQRTVKERSGYKKKVIPQPLIVQDYNTNMGGVDKSN